MWTADPAKLVKVLLHDRGEDVETPWAEDQGPASSPPGARRVRLANVPDVQSAFSALDVAAEQANVVLEGGLFHPKQDRPGRAYLAVPYELGVADVLERLRGTGLPLTFTLVHPVDD